MPPVRRSTRAKLEKELSPPARCNRKRSQMVDEEFQRLNTRVTKRRETLPPDQLTATTFRKLLRTLPSTVAGLMSDDPVVKLHSTRNLSKLLSAENQQPPIDDVVRSGAVPRLIEFLKLDDYQPLQFEAAHVLQNIGSGSAENTKIMVDCGAVPLLVKCIESSSDEIKEPALCALGNIAADSPEYSCLILSCGALNPLLALLYEHNNLSLLRSGVWTVTNLCAGTPKDQMEQLKTAIPVLVSLLSTEDETVLTEACWALSYVFKGGLTQDPDAFTATTCPRILDLVKHPSPYVAYRAIKVFKSICCHYELLKCAIACRVRSLLYCDFKCRPSPHVLAETQSFSSALMDVEMHEISLRAPKCDGCCVTCGLPCHN